MPLCCYCNQEVGINSYTLEHLVPRSKGGNRTKFNLKPCHKKCNLYRGNTDLNKWADQLIIMYNTPGGGHPYSQEMLLVVAENARFWHRYIEVMGEHLRVKNSSIKTIENYRKLSKREFTPANKYKKSKQEKWEERQRSIPNCYKLERGAWMIKSEPV